jgi:hypothetical protein
MTGTANVSELAIWASPVLLAIIGFFFQRELNKQDKKFEQQDKKAEKQDETLKEIFHYLREIMPREFIRHTECLSCQKLSDERRHNCKDIVGRLEHNVGGVVEQIERLEDCIKEVAKIRC